MYASVQAFLGWTFQTFEMMAITVQVLSDNGRALRLYERCGFHKTARITIRNTSTEAAPVATRSLVTLSLSRADWMSPHRLDQAA